MCNRKQQNYQMVIDEVIICLFAQRGSLDCIFVFRFAPLLPMTSYLKEDKTTEADWSFRLFGNVAYGVLTAADPGW